MTRVRIVFTVLIAVASISIACSSQFDSDLVVQVEGDSYTYAEWQVAADQRAEGCKGFDAAGCSDDLAIWKSKVHDAFVCEQRQLDFLRSGAASSETPPPCPPWEFRVDTSDDQSANIAYQESLRREAEQAAFAEQILEYGDVVREQQSRWEALRTQLIDWCLSTGDDISSCEYNLVEPRNWGGRWVEWADVDDRGEIYFDAVNSCALNQNLRDELVCLRNLTIPYPEPPSFTADSGPTSNEPDRTEPATEAPAEDVVRQAITEYQVLVAEQKVERDKLLSELMDWCLSTGDDISSCRYNLNEPHRWGGRWAEWAEADAKGGAYLAAVDGCTLHQQLSEQLACLEALTIPYN